MRGAAASGQARTMTRSAAGPAWRILPAVAVTLAIAACGSSGHKPSASETAAYAFAKCMRTHGVPNFPDPRSSSAGGGFALELSGSVMTVDGVTLSGPAFHTASTACSHLDRSVLPPPLTEAQKQGMVAKAQCIRRHGVPGFPDPTFGPGGYGAGVMLGSGLRPDSPAIESAARACAHVGTPIPGTPT